MPQAVNFELGGGGIDGSGAPAAVRIDSGVREGDAISPFYDPMIVEAGQFIAGHLGRKAASRAGNALAAKMPG